MTFPQFYMEYLHEEDDNEQHTFEQMLTLLWARADHAHVFYLEEVEGLGWQGVWPKAPVTYWWQMLSDADADVDRRMQQWLAGDLNG